MAHRRLPTYLLAACLGSAPAGAALEETGASHGPLPAQALALPAGYDVLIGLNARAIFDSAEYKRLLAGELAGLPLEERQKAEVGAQLAQSLAEVEQKTGIHPQRDVEHVIVAVRGFEEKQPDVVAMVIGRFDAERVTSAFRAAADGGETISSRSVHGRTVYVMARDAKPDAALVVLGPSALVFGSPPAVESTLASHAEKRRALEANARLMALVDGLDPAAGLWLAVGPAATSAMRKSTAEKPPPFPIPESMALASSGTRLDAFLEMADAATARNAADVLRGGLAALRMNLAQQGGPAKSAELEAMLDQVQIASEGERVKLSAPGLGGAGAVGIVAAIAIPSLLRARVSANEAMAIGDIRAVMSAQATYASVANGYGAPACLSEPGDCLQDYTGPVFLDAQLASASDKGGYGRAFHMGPTSQPGTHTAFAYTATPREPGQTGVRSFCGDSSGRICADPSGAAIVPVAGACPTSCADIQ